MLPQIYLSKVYDILEENKFRYLLTYVSPQKKERILRQYIKQQADHMLIGEILAKVAVKKTFGIDIAKQVFAYHEHGKPYLLNYPDICFNISHSGYYVACVVSDNAVGIDVQEINAYNPNVAKKVCTKQELEQIENSADKASEFTKLWTQKEAVLKMRGTGIVGGDIKICLDNQSFQSHKMENYWLSVALSSN